MTSRAGPVEVDELLELLAAVVQVDEPRRLDAAAVLVDDRADVVELRAPPARRARATASASSAHGSRRGEQQPGRQRGDRREPRTRRARPASTCERARHRGAQRVRAAHRRRPAAADGAQVRARHPGSAWSASTPGARAGSRPAPSPRPQLRRAHVGGLARPWRSRSGGASIVRHGDPADDGRPPRPWPRPPRRTWQAVVRRRAPAAPAPSARPRAARRSARAKPRAIGVPSPRSASPITW